VGCIVALLAVFPDFEFDLEDLPIVGEYVGVMVVGAGVMVGFIVGDAVVGDIVGDPVVGAGVIVGFIVGCSVGFMVGDNVGDTVGCIVALPDLPLESFFFLFFLFFTSFLSFFITFSILSSLPSFLSDPCLGAFFNSAITSSASSSSLSRPL